jgi:hypothetical protein
MNKTNEEIDFSELKEKQNYLIYEKVKPENRQIVKNLIIGFDLGYRLNKKLLVYYLKDSEKFDEVLKLYFLERENFLNRMTKDL